MTMHETIRAHITMQCWDRVHTSVIKRPIGCSVTVRVKYRIVDDSLRLGLGSDELDFAVQRGLERVGLLSRLRAYPIGLRLAIFVANERDDLVGHRRVHARVEDEVL